MNSGGTKGIALGLKLTLMVAVIITCSCKSYIRNPFYDIDHVSFSRKKAADNISTHRIIPSQAITHKKSLSLQDCRDLALSRNLKIQAARVNELTKAALRESQIKKTLPHLIFNAELNERDNYAYTFSDVLGLEGLNPSPSTTGTGVTNYSTGRERNTWRYKVELNWSPNDAILAYFLAKNGQNERLRAHYQTVRVAQKLIGSVEAAFFRLLGLQKRLSLAKKMAALRSEVLDEITHLTNKKLKSAEDYHRAKRESIRAERLLNAIQGELQRQREILAGAMGVSPHCDPLGGFSVCGGLAPPKFKDCIPSMEMMAVKNRPESYVAGLNLITSMNDIKRSLVKLFPKLNAFWRFNRDKDRFLYNKDWKEVGLNINFDLTELWSEMDERRAAEMETMKDDRETGVTAITIASQVRNAAILYTSSLKDLKSARASMANSRKFYKDRLVRSRVEDISELDMKIAEADLIEEEMAWNNSLAEANARLAELNEAMGVNYQEPLPWD